MLENEIARKYAEALFELADRDNKLDVFNEQLKTVVDVFEKHAEMRQLMFHPQVKAEVKKDTLQKVFGQELDQMLMNLLMLLVDRRRLVGIQTIWDEYRKRVNDARNVAEAVVTTAVPMTDTARTVMQEKLAKVTGKNIVVHTKIDPAIVGGVIVRIGDKLIDGSVVRQLEDLRRTLTSSRFSR